jgi:hypothetical protein
MDKKLIFGHFEYFHTKGNPEILPNLSRRAAEISGFRLTRQATECLKIENFN